MYDQNLKYKWNRRSTAKISNSHQSQHIVLKWTFFLLNFLEISRIFCFWVKQISLWFSKVWAHNECCVSSALVWPSYLKLSLLPKSQAPIWRTSFSFNPPFFVSVFPLKTPQIGMDEHFPLDQYKLCYWGPELYWVCLRLDFFTLRIDRECCCSFGCVLTLGWQEPQFFWLKAFSRTLSLVVWWIYSWYLEAYWCFSRDFQ